MKFIIGLGNPGSDYAKTRHNAGFMALDYLLQHADLLGSQDKFEAHIKEVHLHDINADKVYLVYPQTFMNDSGIAVRQILDFYKCGPQDIIVIQDEVDLPLGEVRVVTDSGSAGHNGIKSLIDHLGTQAFKRIRIGVEDRPDKSIPPTDKFVLQNFSEEELRKIPFDQVREKVEELCK